MLSATEEASDGLSEKSNGSLPKNGDEQVQGMSLTMSIESPKLADPAILIVREIPRIRYTREQLLKLEHAPLSKKKPDFIDISEISSFVRDPEKWGIERKKADITTDNNSRGDVSDHRRRPGDPRERIRKENDGIVLSPQRRSFNSGCFVPTRDITRTNRSQSPLSKGENSHGSGREIPPGNRRIGSGRIIRDSWDFADKMDTNNGDYPFRGGNRGGERDDKFGDSGRRSFGREFGDTGRDKDKDNGRNSGRYDRRRISNDSHEEEPPEWFSGGPISQNDTIELRGFDEPEKPSAKKKLSPSKVKRAQEWASKKRDGGQGSAEERDDGGKTSAADSKPPATSPTAQGSSGEGDSRDQAGDRKQEGDMSGGDSEKEMPQQAMDDQAFNFDDFWKLDNIPGLPNGVGADGDNAKSRFSAWFKRDSPDKHSHPHHQQHGGGRGAAVEGSTRGSPQDNPHQHHHLIRHLLTDIGEQSVNIALPGDSDSYFAPISPAANTGGGGGMAAPGGIDVKLLNIMELLQHGKPQPQQGGVEVAPGGLKGSQVPSKMLSLDEIESRIRQNNDQPKPVQAKREEDMAAFNRLLQMHSQLHQQQRQHLDMLSKFVQPAAAAAAAAAAAQQHLRTSPLQDLGVQHSRELLSRPEAQAILQGLKRGDITPQHIYQQLANHALQPRHREMLLAIVKLQQQQNNGGRGGGGGMGPSPRVLSPVPPPHHIYSQQQQQQLRVSPHPQNSMHQRIPSPRELQVHTQNILQRALIKKKLEEQQENYRRKQEMQQRGQSPALLNNNNNNATVKSQPSPTPLAFTPTSVLRKMTADKDDGKDGGNVMNKVGDGNMNKVQPQGRAVTGMRVQQQQQVQAQQQQVVQQQVQQWGAQFSLKQPVGRPIVKASSNFQPTGQPSTEQFFTQQQQQRLMNQQAQQQQQRKNQQQATATATPFHPADTATVARPTPAARQACQPAPAAGTGAVAVPAGTPRCTPAQLSSSRQSAAAPVLQLAAIPQCSEYES